MLDEMSGFIGRDRITFDWKILKNLCKIHCTKNEILGIFQCSDTQLEERIRKEYNQTFLEFYAEHSSIGKASLRREQIKKAFSGDSQMLKFLGQNYLKQREQSDLNISGAAINLNYSLDEQKPT